MAPPKGTQFWLRRSSHGRTPIFKNPDALWDACCEYFDYITNTPLWETSATQFQGAQVDMTVPKMRAMTISSLCVFLDISRETWCKWRTVDNLSDTVKKVDEVIHSQKFEGAAAGLLNSNIIARDLGLADRKEHTGKDGGAIETASVTDRERARAIAFALAKGVKDSSEKE